MPSFPTEVPVRRGTSSPSGSSRVEGNARQLRGAAFRKNIARRRWPASERQGDFVGLEQRLLDFWIVVVTQGRYVRPILPAATGFLIGSVNRRPDWPPIILAVIIHI